ncbi:5-deoxy-glucuronate isomerase, partial [bacterium]|nr:5-deoxy-glucuronate isomerase [bacterium]
VRSVGKGAWTRNLYNIIDDRTSAGCLIVGETISPPGNWSSFPPHKHDIENLPEETKLEEVYFFKFQSEDGFGMQRLYTASDSKDKGFDEALVLKNNTATIMPRGYHPVCTAPGYSVYYLWILAGKNRKLIPSEDPQHSWIGKEYNSGD